MRGGASFGGVGVALSDNNAHLVKSKPGQPSRRGSLTWSLGPARLPGEMLLSARSPGRRPGHLVAEPLAWSLAWSAARRAGRRPVERPGERLAETR